MLLLDGVNHVAIVTDDLDRFIAFYTEVFGLEVAFEEDAPQFRHAILRAGPTSWLHPVQVPDNPHGTASPTAFGRGHLDHVALVAASPEAFETARRRLVERGATDGGVDTLGSFHSVWYEDPDGMRGELTLILDPELREVHAPRPLVPQPG